MSIPQFFDLLKSGSSKELFGSKPQYAPLNFLKSYQGTIADNTALLPDASKIAGSTNQYNFDALTKLYQQLDPNYLGSIKQAGQNINAELGGNLTKEQMDNVQRNAAVKAIGGGYQGTPFHGNLVGRDLGLTTGAIQARGLSDRANYVQSLMQSSLPRLAGAQDYMINPQTQLEQTTRRNDLIAEVAAAPDPSKRGEFDARMAELGMILSVYSGGPGYQNAYRSPYQGGGGGGGGGGYNEAGTVDTGGYGRATSVGDNGDSFNYP